MNKLSYLNNLTYDHRDIELYAHGFSEAQAHHFRHVLLVRAVVGVYVDVWGGHWGILNVFSYQVHDGFYKIVVFHLYFLELTERRVLTVSVLCPFRHIQCAVFNV